MVFNIGKTLDKEFKTWKGKKMTKHTPAPWHIVTDGISHWIEIEPNKIALIKANEADRNLIAAAPDLLAALVVLHSCHRAFSNSENWTVFDDEARLLAENAINKAKGE